MIKLKIHILMAEHRLTQKEVAKKTGISPAVMNKYYNDTIIRITREHLDAFCKLFNCKIQDLIEYIPEDSE